MSDVMQSSIVGLNEDQEELKPVNPVSTLSTAGEHLAASRQNKKWSVQFVAEQLKLSQAQIVALEASNFDALPKMVIVRGFVRAYAKLLKIDSDSLVALLPQDAVPVQLESSLRPALSTPFVESRLSLLGQHDNNRRYIIGAIFLVIVVAVFLLIQTTEFGKNLRSVFDKKDPVLIDTPVSASSTALDIPAVVVPQSQSTVPSASVASVPALSENAVASSLPSDVAGAKSVEQSPAIAETNVNVTATTDQEKISTTSATNLPPLSELFVLKFRQDSWIQVKTETGTILSSHLARAGSEESFSVKQTLYVKLGNAAGVDAVLRGNALPIASERGNNVANLVVK